MIYQVLEDWRIEDRQVPVGVIYNGTRPVDIAWINWLDGTGQAGMPPVTVQPHDQEAYNVQRARFPDKQIPATAGIIRAP